VTRCGWVWIVDAVLLAVHDEQLAEHGGAPGTRDIGLLESASARPRNSAHYGTPDAGDLAAAYGFGIARNHPFIDGNKRAAFVAVELFLALNGLELLADDSACVMTMRAVAAGQMDEAAFANWLRAHTAAR
jgi:death-on-curing protein